MKRLLDFLGAFILLFVLALPIFVIAILIYTHDNGPVFYKQTRVGKDCKTFLMLKFRSMIADADQIGGYQTFAGDERITSIGKFLRRTSLDELPQLINVLIGDMSFVGPRPDVPVQESLYTLDDWKKRHKIRPGITGLSQVTGRSNISAEDRLRYDLEYVDKSNILLDIKILLKTIGFVSKGF